MHIVVDENIPLAETFLNDIGKVTRVPGRTLTSDQLMDADALLVRSITQVNESLLKGTKVKFVGTATIGVDHIDLDYLNQNRIGFSSAPGCNAPSVANYVISVLNFLGYKTGQDWLNKKVSIIGCGNVGKTVLAMMQSLDMDVQVYDPFLDPAIHKELPLVSFEEILQTDVITMHTPYTKDGEFPTHHLVNQQVLESIGDHTWLINAGRGGAIDNQALKEKLKLNPDFIAVLDVWENEPSIDLELMKLVTLATPHIAGYSLDGKLTGTEMIYQALCHQFGLPIRLKLAQLIPEPELKLIQFSDEISNEEAFRIAIKSSYDVYDDHLRTIRELLAADEHGVAFDQLRKHYPKRRDFSGLKVQLKRRDQELVDRLEGLGFKVKV